MEVTGLSKELTQSQTRMAPIQAAEDGVKSTLDQMSKTGGSMRDVKKQIVHGIKVGKRSDPEAEAATSQDGGLVFTDAAHNSAVDFVAASATSRSLISQNTAAEVVSKGGNIPDQYRES